MSQYVEITVDFDYEGEEFSCGVEVDFHYSFTPGRYDGPPCQCYPDEEEFEIEGIEIKDRYEGNWELYDKNADYQKKVLDAMTDKLYDMQWKIIAEADKLY